MVHLQLKKSKKKDDKSPPPSTRKCNNQLRYSQRCSLAAPIEAGFWLATLGSGRQGGKHMALLATQTLKTPTIQASKKIRSGWCKTKRASCARIVWNRAENRQGRLLPNTSFPREFGRNDSKQREERERGWPWLHNFLRATALSVDSHANVGLCSKYCAFLKEKPKHRSCIYHSC